MSLARLPISWFQLTNMDLKGKTYAIENEKEEVFVTVTTPISNYSYEKMVVDDTRVTSDKYQYCIANLIYVVLIADGVPRSTIMPWIYALRRRVNLEVLEGIATYLDQRGDGFASEIDRLRSRLEKLVMPDTLVQRQNELPVLQSESSLVRKARRKVLTLEDMGLKYG